MGFVLFWTSYHCNLWSDLLPCVVPLHFWGHPSGTGWLCLGTWNTPKSVKDDTSADQTIWLTCKLGEFPYEEGLTWTKISKFPFCIIKCHKKLRKKGLDQICINSVKIHSKYLNFPNKSKINQKPFMKTYLEHPWTLTKEYTIHQHIYNIFLKTDNGCQKVTYSLADIPRFEEFFLPTNCQIKTM